MISNIIRIAHVVLIIFFIGFLSLSTGCEAEKSSERKNTTDSLQNKNTHTFTFTVDSLVYRHPECSTEDSLQNCTHITYEKMSAENASSKSLKKIVDEIHRSALILISENVSEKKMTSIDSIKDVFFESWSIYEEETKGEKTFPWYVHLKSSVDIVHDTILSCQLDVYSFTGGAHGNTYKKYMTFNLNSTERLNLSENLKNPGFLSTAEKAFREKVDIADDADLEEEGFFFDNGRFHLSEEIGLNKNGIVLYYNDYEIRPHAEGPLKVVIPYNKVNIRL